MLLFLFAGASLTPPVVNGVRAYANITFRLVATATITLE